MLCPCRCRCNVGLAPFDLLEKHPAAPECQHAFIVTKPSYVQADSQPAHWRHISRAAHRCLGNDVATDETVCDRRAVISVNLLGQNHRRQVMALFLVPGFILARVVFPVEHKHRQFAAEPLGPEWIAFAIGRADVDFAIRCLRQSGIYRVRVLVVGRLVLEIY